MLIQSSKSQQQSSKISQDDVNMLIAGCSLLFGGIYGIKYIKEESNVKFEKAVKNESCKILSGKKRRAKCESIVAEKVAARLEEIRRAEEIRLAEEKRKKEELDRQAKEKHRLDSIAEIERVTRYKRDSTRRAEQQAERLADEKHREDSIYRKYGTENGKIILEGKVKLGFTKNMCLEAWGPPYDITKTVSSGMLTEFWFYYNGGIKGSSLFFVNGKLETIQN